MKEANESLKQLEDALSQRGSKRFFFSQDSDCHWYMIPVVLRERWKALTQEDSEENDDAIYDEFSNYLTGGDISHISFISPREEK